MHIRRRSNLWIVFIFFALESHSAGLGSSVIGSLSDEVIRIICTYNYANFVKKLSILNCSAENYFWLPMWSVKFHRF